LIVVDSYTASIAFLLSIPTLIRPILCLLQLSGVVLDLNIYGALVLKFGRSLEVVVVDWVGVIFASCVCAVILVGHTFLSPHCCDLLPSLPLRFFLFR